METPRLLQAFEVLQDREAFFQKILEDKFPTQVIGNQLILMALFTFLYGAVMGSYNSWMQATSAGVKLFALFVITLVICFPSFFIVQMILGSKIKLKPLVIIILSGFVMTTTIMVAFAPIIVFFQMSGDNYYFLQLLHVAIFIFAGIFGMKIVMDGLQYAFEKTEVYPKIGVTVFRIWIVIFAFVGVQMSWNLRPFVGKKNMEFQLFREDTQGNFYKTLVYSVGNLMGVTESDKKNDPSKAPEPQQERIEKKEQEIRNEVIKEEESTLPPTQ